MSQHPPRDAGSGDHLRSLFLADQNLFAGAAGGASRGLSNEPSTSSNGVVGWGGAMLPQDLSSARVPWFGRSRKVPAHRQRSISSAGGASSGGSTSGGGGPAGGAGGLPPAAALAGAGSPGSLTGGGGGGGGGHHGASSSSGGDEPLSVDEAVALVRQLPASDPLPDRLLRSLRHLDSRAVALLLKDLSKAGADDRAIELFDWLRALPERHVLRALCDVYAYTAMISLCIYQQNVDRAMELLAEMRARGVERNVHTYTALMNVCIKVGVARLLKGGGGRVRGSGSDDLQARQLGAE
jgi:pentatricopeptide repeat domain-containing protein 1